jgi:uncharacterized protein (TIGR02246 family)
MSPHALVQVVAQADDAINREDFDRLVEFYAPDGMLVVMPGKHAVGHEALRNAFVRIAEHFNHTLRVSQREVQVLEAGDTALVLARTHVQATMKGGEAYDVERRATYVFRKDAGGVWRCVVDNSYGTDLLQAAGT